MDITISSKNSKNELELFFIVFLLNIFLIIPLIIFSNVHYSIDTYAIQLTEGAEHINNFLGSYRYFGAFIYWLILIIGHNPILNPLPDTLFFIFVVAFADTVLSLSIYKILNNKSIYSLIIIELSVLITSTNVWFTDMLTFPECISLTAVGLLCCFLGIVFLSVSKKLWKWLIASILFIFAAATYQQFISIFFIYSVLILCIRQAKSENNNIKNIFIYCIKLLLFFVFNSLIYFISGVIIQKLLNIVPNPRASINIYTVIENIKYFARQQHSFLKGRGFFSTEVLTICYFLVAIIFLFSLIAFWKKTSQTAKTVFIAIAFVFAYFSSYLPGLVSTSHGTRTICALFSVFALLSVGAISVYHNKVLSAILVCVLGLVFGLNMYKNTDRGINQIISNTKESLYVNDILNEIDKYEQKNDVIIDTIGICYDKNGDSETEALYVDYAIMPLIQLNTDKKMKFVDVPENIANKYFEENDWKKFDADKQIIYEKNVAYICVY